MGVIDSIKKGFGVATHSMSLVLLLFAFGAVFGVVNVSLSGQLQGTTPPTNQASVMAIIVGIVFVLISIFMQAGSMGYVRDRLKTGKANLSGFAAAGGKYYLRLLLIGFLISAVIGLFVLIGALLVTFLQTVGTVLAVILGIVGLYVVLLMFLAPYGVVVDEKGAISSIKQSMRLVTQNILKVAGIGIILILIAFGFGLLIGVLLGLLSVAVQGAASQIIFAVVNSFLNAFLGVFVTGSFMAFYLAIARNSGETSAIQ
jgi:hypothetical protein